MNTDIREDIPEIPAPTTPHASWWLSAAPREGFTALGARETAKTAHSLVAAGVAFRIIQE